MGLRLTENAERAAELNVEYSPRVSIEEVIRRGFSTARTDASSIYYYDEIQMWIHDHPEESEATRLALKSPFLVRTAGLRQLGFHPDPTDLKLLEEQISITAAVEGITALSRKLFDHRRLTYILKVSADGRIAVSNLGLPPEQQNLFLTAALSHDNGHATFSHVGDTAVRYFIDSTHEQRSVAIMRRIIPTPINDKIQAIVEEKTGLGQILRVMDTLTYLQWDAEEAGMIELGLPILLPLFGRHIQLDGKTGLLSVDAEGKAALQQLLDVRKTAYGLLYTHPFSLIVEAMHVKGLKLLIEMKAISLEDLLTRDDDYVYSAFQANSSRDPRIAHLFGAFNTAATTISRGPYRPIDWLPLNQLGDVRPADLEKKIELNLGMDPADFVVSFPQPTDKVIKVLTEAGEEDLQGISRPHHLLQESVIVSTYQGIGKASPPGFAFR